MIEQFTGKTIQNEDQASARLLNLVQQGYSAEEAHDLSTNDVSICYSCSFFFSKFSSALFWPFSVMCRPKKYTKLFKQNTSFRRGSRAFNETRRQSSKSFGNVGRHSDEDLLTLPDRGICVCRFRPFAVHYRKVFVKFKGNSGWYFCLLSLI